MHKVLLQQVVISVFHSKNKVKDLKFNQTRARISGVLFVHSDKTVL